jgi:hypothetical protein
MCVQDYNLAQAAQMVKHSIVLAAGVYTSALPPNKSRVGLYFVGPDTGQFDCTFQVGADAYKSIQIRNNQEPNQRRMMLPMVGKLIQEELFIRGSSATTAIVFEYLLPLDAQTRLLFAEGKNNK